MKALYSYWDLNSDYRVKKNWYNDDFKWLTLSLSVYYSLKYYDKVEMVTTSPMKKFFKEIGIPFTKITTELDDLNYNKKLWILSKIKTYSLQTEPFIHIDNDFILFDKPVINTILIQEIERFENDFYKNNYSNKLDKSRKNFINKPSLFDVTNKSVCMGVYGVTDLSFNEIYCNKVFQLINDNKDYLLKQTDVINFGIILEQYMLSTISEENNIDLEEINVKFLHLLEHKYNNRYYDYIKEEVKSKLPNVFKNININNKRFLR